MHCSRYAVASAEMALNLDSNSEIILGRQERPTDLFFFSFSTFRFTVSIGKPVEDQVKKISETWVRRAHL